MCSWFQTFSIEDFAKSYQFSIQVLIAIATWAAVIVSLRLALSSRKSYLNSRVAIVSTMIPTVNGTYQSTDEKLLLVTIQNVGQIPVYRNPCVLRKLTV